MKQYIGPALLQGWPIILQRQSPEVSAKPAATTEIAIRRTASVSGMEQGEPPTTASGWSLVGGEVNRNERSARWAVAMIEVAEASSQDSSRKPLAYCKRFKYFNCRPSGSILESGERGERQPSGLSAIGGSEPNESTEREGKVRSKDFERPLRLRSAGISKNSAA